MASRRRGRGGDAGNWNRNHQQAPASGTKRFPKEPAMRTFSALSAQEKRERQRAEQNSWLGQPPADVNLTEATLVVPGNELLPSALEDRAAIDELCQTHQVWINNKKPNVFVISCEEQYPKRLQEAVIAFNWAIHDMRLSDEHPATRFVAQQSLVSGTESTIRVIIGQRPCVTFDRDATAESAGNEHIVNSLWKELGPHLEARAETIMGLGKDVQMRVNFGRLNIRRKKKGLGDEFTFEDFQKLIRTYGTRGGAGLGYNMPDTDNVSTLIATFMSPTSGFHYDRDSLVSSCTMTLATAMYGDISAEISGIATGKLEIASMKMTGFEEWSRLNWTVAAPDMLFDWNLEVKACKFLQGIPADLEDFIRKIKLEMPVGKAMASHLILPKPSARGLKQPDAKVLETRMKSSVRMTLRDGQYFVEIGVTRVWNELALDKKPQALWSIELYGKRWEEALNTVSSDGRRRDWGKDLINVWPGSGSSLEDRFKVFLRCVLNVQACLNRVDFDITPSK